MTDMGTRSTGFGASPGRDLSKKRRPATKRGAILKVLVAVALAGSALSVPFAGQAHAVPLTFVVNSTNPTLNDVNPGNGSCATGSGCNLRAAIQEANAHAGIDTINFNIAAAPQFVLQ